MKKKLIILSGSILGSMPLLASAQTTGQVSCRGVGLRSIEGIVCKIGDILNIVIPILIVLGVVLLYGELLCMLFQAMKKQRKREG